MVRRDQVDGAVRETAYDRHPVALGAQRRVDLRERAFREDRVFRQGEVMGRGLRMDGRMRSADAPHRFNAFFRADVLDAQRRVQRCRDLNVARDQRVLRFPRRPCQSQRFRGSSAAVDPVLRDITLVFLMQADRKAQPFRGLQRLGQKGAVHDGHTVIRKSCCTAGGERLKIAQFPALHPLRHIRAAVQMYRQILSARKDV